MSETVGRVLIARFSRADFIFDQQRNIYILPGGTELTSTGNIDQRHIVSLISGSAYAQNYLTAAVLSQVRPMTFALPPGGKASAPSSALAVTALTR